MTITRIQLFDLSLPLIEPFVISGGSMRERRSLVVVMHDAEGHRGYGESPPFELPFYSEETTAGARHLLEHVLIPRLLGAEQESPEAVDAAIRVGVRGNSFARAAVETAAWDLEAHRRKTGLAALLGERLGVDPAEEVPCGVALGIPVDRSPDTLRRWVTEAIAAGYRRVKIKVAPGWDEVPVRAARDAMAGTASPPHRRRQRRLRVAGARAGPARAGRRRAALHRAAPAPRRAGRPCASGRAIEDPGVRGRDAS